MPESRFLVACNEAAYERYGSKCAIVSDKVAGPANSNGNNQIAFISTIEAPAATTATEQSQQTEQTEQTPGADAGVGVGVAVSTTKSFMTMTTTMDSADPEEYKPSFLHLLSLSMLSGIM